MQPLKTAVNQIRNEIAESGAIPFARFMALALYCPDCGYYEKEKDTLGQRGDFYTSVSVGSLFGELLAYEFAQWLQELPMADGRLRIVEAGAHDGKLARDIAGWLCHHRGQLFERVEYLIIEPSTRRQAWQRETLKEFGSKVRWSRDLSTSAPSTICGVIFSNELLDAMPVRRLGWDAKRREWFEWGVAFDRDQFVWARMPAILEPSSLVFYPSRDLANVLPDGFTTEVCPDADVWWRLAARALRHGKLLTLDYGLGAEEFFTPQRANGTLRACHRHRFVDDVLANPGEQDLTAHVNFTAIQRAGEAVGLKTEALVSQAKFLTGIAQRAWAEGSDFGSWTQERTRQFQTLTHPDHLGRPFKVLLQSRDGDRGHIGPVHG